MSRSVLQIVARLLVVGLFALALPVALRADNAGVQFSPTNNPSGNWSYGYTNSLGGTLSLYTTQQPFLLGAGISSWNSQGCTWTVNCPVSAPSIAPFLGANTSGGSVLPGGTFTSIPAGMLVLHPGLVGEYSVLRWTAPSAGTYSLGGLFQGVDTFPTTTDVYILLNGNAIFSGSTSSSGIPLNFSLQLTLNAGDHLDFAVGFGNGNASHDSTGLVANVNPVPEPGTMVLLGTGLAGLLASRRRKIRLNARGLKWFTLLMLCFAGAGAAQADSAFTQFSLVNNPSGNWSYGLTPTLGGSFQLYNSSSNIPGIGVPPYGTLPVWNTPSGLAPFLGANTFGTQILPCPSCSLNIPPGFLILSPELFGSLSVLRWTAPSAGTYTISGLFQGVDFQPHPTTDTHILHNGIEVYSNFLNTFAVPQNFSLTLQLNAGDTIDFAVGYGGDSLSNDSTGLVANINPVPEPGTMLLLGTGLAGIGARARRRKNL